MKKLVFLLTLVFILVPTTVYGAGLQNGATLSMKVDGIHSSDGTLTAPKDSPDYNQLLSMIGEGIKQDAEKGLAELKNSSITSDHLKMKNWGQVLYYYAGKAPSEMPSTQLKIYGIGTDNFFLLNNDRETKEWIQSDLMPYIKKVITEVANNYSCDVHIYTPSKVQELSSFASNFETFETKLTYSITPISEDMDTLNVHSMGADYGIQLNTKYVAILDSIDKDNGSFKLLKKEGTKVSVVKITAELATPKTIGDDLNFKAKKLSDMAIYDGLAVNLITGGLMLPDSIDGFKVKSAGDYSKNMLVKEDLLVLGLEDGVCVVPAKLSEVTSFGGKILPTGVTADFSKLLSGIDEINLSNGQTEKISSYVGKDGLLKCDRGKQSPFLLYCQDSNIPYPRLVGFLVSDASGAYLTEKQAQDMVKQIKNIYTKNGKSAEWKVVAKQYNVSSGLSLPLLGGAVVCLVLAGALTFIAIKKGKFKKKETNTPDLLFNTEDEEDTL